MLLDKTVFVTGASSGMGEACARRFAEQGARVLLCARREDRLRALAGTLDTDTHVFRLDVRDRAAVDAAMAGLPASWRDIDILVNNAGLAAGLSAFPENDAGDWDRMLDTNVRGLLNVTRAVLPGMIERGHGHVINIGSVAGRDTYPGGAVYCATKAAVDRITKGLRMDVLGTGVRVSSVDPGLVETEFSLVRFHGDADAASRVYQGMTPLTADDVAETVVWIADRPAHVQVAEVLLLASDQATATMVHRRT